MPHASTPPANPLRSLLDDGSRERVSLAELLTALRGHAMPALVLLFAAPNAVPMPPGTSAILGAPLLLLTLQWWCGIGPWLPARLLALTMPRRDLARWLERGAPWLRHTHARLLVFATPPCERVAGAFASLLALIVFLPIPLGNMPPALSISVMAIGFMRKDGAWVLAGAVLGMASLAIASGVVWGAARILAQWW
jgi:hypothetical protein